MKKTFLLLLLCGLFAADVPAATRQTYHLDENGLTVTIERGSREHGDDGYRHRRAVCYSLEDIEKFQGLREANIIGLLEFNDKRELILKHEGETRADVRIRPDFFEEFYRLKKMKDNGALWLIDYGDKQKDVLQGLSRFVCRGSEDGLDIFQSLYASRALLDEDLIGLLDFNTLKDQLLSMY